MSCHYTELCQSPVTVTESRFYLNGEPWVLTREADLPIYVERQADLPQMSISTVEHASNQPLPERHQQSLFFAMSSQGETPSTKIKLDSPGACQKSWQRILEPEPPYPMQPQALRTSHETHNCVGTGSCKRLHLSHPHLRKKIVQKARRVLSKLGSKTCRNSTIPLAVPQYPIDYTTSTQDVNAHSRSSFELTLPELSVGDGIVYELPAEKVAADRAVVHEAPGESAVRYKPPGAGFGYHSDAVSPQTPFHRYSGSRSSISNWSQQPWQSSLPIRCTSNTDLADLTSPTGGPCELEGTSLSSYSSSSPFSLSTAPTDTSCILPVIDENALDAIGPTAAGSSDSLELDVDSNVGPEPIVWQKQALGDSIMGDWDLSPSPTSLLLPSGFSDQLIEADQIHELGSGTHDTYKPIVCEDAAIGLSSHVAAMHKNPWNRTSTFSTCSASDSDIFDDSHITMPVCPCHSLPMRPGMDLSDLVTGAKRYGLSPYQLVQDDQRTLCSRMESMFNLLLELAHQRLDTFQPEVLVVLAPAFEARPTFQASLKAVHDLHITESLTNIHGLVSLVFMAFSIAILTIDERDLSQYTGVLYIDIASWTDALSTNAEKEAFSTFLKLLWFPQVRYAASSFQQREFCPFTVPKGLSTQDWKLSPLSNHVGLRSGMAVRLCLYYVDLIHHAAEKEVASSFNVADHVLDRDRPPRFVDSAMADVVQPYLEQHVSETIREVASSTAQVLRNGEFSSFNEVDAHLRSGILKHRGHIGTESTYTSQFISARCYNAAIMFAGRKVAWLMKILQDSASRVVSQTWAESVYTLGIMPNRSLPSLTKPRGSRRIGRQRKGPQDMVPLRCSQCAGVFEGKYRRDHLRRHLKSVHIQHYINCELCGAKLKVRSDNVAKHMRVCRSRHGH